MPIQAKPVRITDTILRDAHQSLLATRMRVEDMLAVGDKLDRVGFHSLEMWGGATFDSSMRFLRADPWERVKLLRQAIPSTPFQMLLRGQNVVGYRHYADDVVERFVYHAAEVGIDIFRVFDALNDIRNMETAFRAIKKVGRHIQGSISYTISPVHDIPSYVDMARHMVDMGADSICIKDMAGLLAPYVGYELVSQLKQSFPNVPVQVHTHYTSGMASSALIKTIEAGADVVDTAISSLAMGTAQPPTESIVASLQGTAWDTGLNLDLLSELAQYFAQIRDKYRQYEGKLRTVDVRVLRYQIPGGMLSNLDSQLREQNALDRYEDVLAEVPRVRADMGYPPLVTPSSQIVGTQAVLNVIAGERYKIIPKEVQQYVLGYYGRPPAPIDPEVQKIIIGDQEPITCRPADLLEAEMEKSREALGDLARSERDVISNALFPQVAPEFLRWRHHFTDVPGQVVAAIAAAVAYEPPEQAARPAQKIKRSWKWAGRIEATGSRSLRTW
ncbi:MAG: pyruvate/oxaloacetate carboxyltransferase [Chloroflexia bacterium]|nr:pyruvate/oxaloacetate carboxyltransferase [Chloroflexia bacterium]